MSEFCHSNVIYFAHALDIYRTSPMRVHVLTQKSEEATASSASLLAMLLRCMMMRNASMRNDSVNIMSGL